MTYFYFELFEFSRMISIQVCLILNETVSSVVFHRLLFDTDYPSTYLRNLTNLLIKQQSSVICVWFQLKTNCFDSFLQMLSIIYKLLI